MGSLLEAKSFDILPANVMIDFVCMTITRDGNGCGWLGCDGGGLSVVLGLKWRKFGKWFSVGAVVRLFESEKMIFWGARPRVS